MSLLEEILSSIKRELPSGEVPPNLKRIVSSSMMKQRTRRRAVFLSIFALVMIGIGYGAIQFFEAVPSKLLKQEDNGKVLQALKGLKAGSFQTPSVQPAATIDPPQSPPLPPAVTGKQAAPGEREPARVLAVADDERKPVRRTNPPDATRKNQPHVSRRDPNEGANPSGIKGFGTTEGQPGTANTQRVQSVRLEPMPAEKTEKDRHLYTAKSYETAGDFGKALTEYRKALELDPHNPLILNNVAGVLLRLGLYRDAGVYAEKALVARNDHVPSLVNLAVARIKSGEAGEGVKCLSRALQLAPTDRAALSNLALFYEKAGEYAKSYELYRRLSTMDDTDGYLGMARICEKENRPKDAETIYRNILKREPDKRAKKIAAERLAALGSAPDSAR